MDVQSYHLYYQTWCYYVVTIDLKNNNIRLKHSIFHCSCVCVCVSLFFFLVFFLLFMGSLNGVLSLFFLSYCLCLMLSLYPSDEAFLIELVLFMSIILCNMIFYVEANYSAFYIRLCWKNELCFQIKTCVKFRLL